METHTIMFIIITVMWDPTKNTTKVPYADISLHYTVEPRFIVFQGVGENKR